MNGFLAGMAEASRERVRQATQRESLVKLRARIAGMAQPPGLPRDRSFGLIAEYKRRSPALGRLAAGGNDMPGRIAAYAQGGALAVSILTEPSQFEGRLEDLHDAAAILAPQAVPVMRKDFLVDPYQVLEARVAGAGGVLLILRILSDAQLAEMIECAGELGLFVLLEAFDATDIMRASAASVRPRQSARSSQLLIGVNCRDLQTLEVMPHRFAELAPLLPAHLPRVAESGIATPDDCAGVARCGYGMALVGGSLMSATDPAEVVRNFVAAGQAAARKAA